MIIDYIYLYDKVNKIEINLNHKYCFEFNATTKRLIKKKNENYIEDLFGENIRNINALVGKNGAGKTRAVKQIINLLMGGSEQLKSEYLLYVYDELEKNNVIISNIEKISIGNEKISTKPIQKIFKNSIAVFYSNVFDGNNIFEYYDNFINLSTNSILSEYNNKVFSLSKYIKKETQEHIEFVILYKDLLNLSDYCKPVIKQRI